jgi:hypothetical protein
MELGYGVPGVMFTGLFIYCPLVEGGQVFPLVHGVFAWVIIKRAIMV